MTSKTQIKISKTLSFILRHNIGKDKEFKCDEHGFVQVSDILLYTKKNKIKCTIDDIINVVNTSEKKRFTIEFRSGEFQGYHRFLEPFIKANQGHSLTVADELNDDVTFTQIFEPLEHCIHGTETKYIESIRKNGLNRMKRKHIHFVGEIEKKKQLSGFKSTSDIAIEVDMKQCMDDGIVFYKSANNVILSEGINGIIAPKYFKVILNI